MRSVAFWIVPLCLGNVATANAQGQDVVVMRRAISPPVAASTPSPTPSSTPTPTPSSTPTPSPAPVPTGSWAEVSRTVQPSCSQSASVVVNYACFLPNGGGQTTDDQCAEPKPVLVESEPNFATCSYTWLPQQYSAWSTTCGKATRTVTVQCVRDLTDEADTSVSESFCVDSPTAGPKPAEQEGPVSVTSGCSEILRNADFNMGAAVWTGYWTPSSDAGHNRSGFGAYIASTSSTPGSINQNIATVPGWTYRLTFWSRMWSDNNSALGPTSMLVKSNGVTLTGNISVSTSPEWTQNTMQWTANSTLARIVVGMASYNTNDRMVVDDFVLEVIDAPL